MPKFPQLSGDDFEYKGVRVRHISDSEGINLINLSDLWKSEGKPWAARPDLWAKQEANKKLIEEVSSQSDGLVWKPLKGGGAFQGTFAAPEIALRYTQSLSMDCFDWLCGVLDTTEGTAKAKRRIIHLGEILLEVFQLPSGEYRLSQTQVADAIEKDERSFREFLASKSPEALPYKGFHSAKLPVEDSNAPIKPIPVDLAIAYWTKEACTGNSIAIRILAASAREAIERRADKAFGVNRTEEEYNFRFKNAFERLIDFFPDYVNYIGDANSSVIADPMILAEKDVFRKIKKRFSSSMFKTSKLDFIRDFVVIGAQTNDWHFDYSRALPYPDGAANRSAYPDLISQPAECLVDGEIQKVVLLFQGVDTIVDETHIKDCFYIREYIELVKKELSVDHALLFFVSPYGVTKYAAGCIKDSDDLRGCVGVITVRQLAKFLIEKASENKRDNIRLGKLRNLYKHLTEYKMLDELDEQSKTSIQTKALPDNPFVQYSLFDML